MAERDPAEQVQIKIRLRRLHLAHVEAAALRNGYPLSTELTRRIEETIRSDNLGPVVFGSAERFAILDTIDRLALAIQMTTGKGWADDETRFLIADRVSAFLKHGAEIYATLMSGKSPNPEAARTAADAFALQLVAQIIAKDLERRTAEAMPPDEAAAKPAGEAAE